MINADTHTHQAHSEAWKEADADRKTLTYTQRMSLVTDTAVQQTLQLKARAERRLQVSGKVLANNRLRG